MCVHLNKEDSQGTMTLTDNKEERLQKNDGSSMHYVSCIGINYAHRFPSVSCHFTHCWDFHSALRVNKPIVVAVPIYSISDLYANSLKSFTLRKRSCEVLSLQEVSTNTVLPQYHFGRTFRI